MFSVKDYQKAYYLQHRARTLAKDKVKYQLNGEAIREARKVARTKESSESRARRLAYHSAYREAHRAAFRERTQTDEYKYLQYESAALRRGYSFELDFSAFVALFHASCTYCGMVEARGIDRVDNDEGYTPENSTSCCELCNKMKWRFSKNDFLAHAKAISSFNPIS